MKTYTEEELKKILELHAKWLTNEKGGERACLEGACLEGAYLEGANPEGANLEGAYLEGANLEGACLERANLEGAYLEKTNGNNGEIKTIQTGFWVITYTESVIQIGCKNYTIKEWFDFPDVSIKKMNDEALEFWKKWKPILELIGVFDKIKAARETE